MVGVHNSFRKRRVLVIILVVSGTITSSYFLAGFESTRNIAFELADSAYRLRGPQNSTITLVLEAVVSFPNAVLDPTLRNMGFSLMVDSYPMGTLTAPSAHAGFHPASLLRTSPRCVVYRLAFQSDNRMISESLAKTPTNLLFLSASGTASAGLYQGGISTSASGSTLPEGTRISIDWLCNEVQVPAGK